jgi:hypothetical protein
MNLSNDQQRFILSYIINFVLLDSEVFRFVTIRTPQIQSEKNSHVIKIYLKSLGIDSAFIQGLKEAKVEGSRDRMIELAKTYLKSEEFVDSPKNIDDKYTRFALIIKKYSNQSINDYLKTNYDKIFSEHARTVVLSSEFKKTYERITDSIIASLIVSNLPAPTNSFLVSVFYMLYLISQLATDSLPSARIIDAKIVLPGEIFPLPEVSQNFIEQRKKTQEQIKKVSEEKRKKINVAVKTLHDNETALKEIIGTFEKTELGDTSGKRGFVLSKNASAGMTKLSRHVLRSHGFITDKIDVTKSITVLEKSRNDSAIELYKHMNQGTKMVRMGSSLMPDYVVSSNTFDPNPDRFTPGICPLAIIEESSIMDNVVTVPKINGSKRKPLIADLMIVEQKLSRYEMGEIAHIENVLKKEIRERELRTSKTTEESLLVETEETEEKQKDLATTDRNELQNETQKVINENASYDAGVTISYDGPTVDATANANYSHSNSSQQSHQLSSKFAREITSRASSRIESRKMQRRFTRTVEVIEEINKHKFDNTDGPDHISGIYRWVDKIYEAQVVNYGKRFMLEFIIPEPAAFLRYAAVQMPNGEEVVLVKPDPPGSCMSDGKTFQPLKVDDIQPGTYLFWVAKYNVEDVLPPPPLFMIASKSIVNKGGEGDMREVQYKDPDLPTNKTVTYPTSTSSRPGAVTTTTTTIPADNTITTWVGASEKEIDLPDGYIPTRAFINLKGLQSFNTATLTVQIQDKEVSNQTVGGGGLVDLHITNTSSIPVTVESFGFALYEIIVNIFCTRSIEKFQEWQLATYSAIMNSYNDKKSRYEAAVESVKIRTGYDPIKGKNPIYNREIEKTELKKGCISLLTGQRFDDFDAVNMNVAPHGFPEIDFEDAKAEGDYIKFFEQAFEWTSMTYLFYPYFWSNKKEWVMLSRLDDADPLYARFLQAGSARVQVPIRSGFESAMLSFVSGAQIWNNDGEFILDSEIDDTYLSIAEEFKSQTGNNSVQGSGTLHVIKDSTNVQGTDTEFIHTDEGRQITIKGSSYVIKKVDESTQKIILKTKYLGGDDAEANYVLGGILVGQPWEIRLPTNLVRLNDSTDLFIDPNE